MFRVSGRTSIGSMIPIGSEVPSRRKQRDDYETPKLQPVCLSGQAMKIERSGYEPEIKTNMMVATVVTNPNIHYLLTCSPDRNDCELLLAGERYDFTPAPERVYPTGPNLATHGDGKRIVVLVQRTNTF